MQQLHDTLQHTRQHISFRLKEQEQLGKNKKLTPPVVIQFGSVV